MLDFLIIFAAALAGFVHAPVAVVVVAAGGLFAMSYWRHADVYERGMTLGLTSILSRAALMSGWNAIAASGMAFVGGVVIRLATWG
jgi:hypothetical protein